MGTAGLKALVVALDATPKAVDVLQAVGRVDVPVPAPLKSLCCLDPVRCREARRLLLGLGLSLSLFVSRAAATDVAAFLAVYRGAVQQQMARRTSLEVEGVSDSVRTRNKKDASPIRIHTILVLTYTRNPAHEKLQSHFIEKPGPVENMNEVTVIVQGAKRNFWLKKPSPGGAFAITMMETPSAASEDPANRPRGFFVEAWNNLGAHSVAKLLDSPGFRVERVEPEGDLIGVDFSFQPEGPKKGLMAGHFAVDPVQGMAIRRQDVRRWNRATPDKVEMVHGEATYRMVDGIAFPDEVTLQFGRPNQPLNEDLHFRATRVSAAPVPDSAFTLAAFGLGDVDRPASRSRFDFVYWAVGLASIAFALSLFLRWRGRQPARAGDRPLGVSG